MKIAIFAAFVLILALAGYFFLRSDKGLLDRDYAMQIASSALGDRLYGPGCPRNQYADNVKSQENKSSFVFGFTPKPTADKNCIFTKVVIDRKTGEIWLDRQG